MVCTSLVVEFIKHMAFVPMFVSCVVSVLRSMLWCGLQGHLQFFMKDYEKAMETYEQGLKQDPNNEELKEGKSRCVQQLSKVCTACP